MAEEKLLNNDNELGIVVDDGYIHVPIRNISGMEIGVFGFRPADIGIVDRYNKAVAEFDKIVEPLQSIDIAPNGSVDEQDEAAFKAMQEARTRLCDAVDFLFDGNASEAFFGKMHPFSPVNGRFYCENVLEAVGKYISNHFGKETKKISDRVKRYTSGMKKRT